MGGSIIDIPKLPPKFPTHAQRSEFWEALGRAVATFGFLEEVLGKAIFALSATRPIPENELETEFRKWLPTLKKALSDPLSALIKNYEAEARKHPHTTITDLDELIEALCRASEYRNALCHGSWSSPDEGGGCIPFFVNRKNEVFHTRVDLALLERIQQHTADLACAVINSVTSMGWQFPGGAGPGSPILPS